jgi:predicted Zn-dependent protease with MMP-like domain
MYSLVDRVTFEEFVAEALDSLPEELARRLDNVDVVVQDWASQETLRQAGVDNPMQLLGFYHGIPLTERTHSYYLVLPDKISIYRQPILAQCRTREQVRALVQRVVRHEIAHHFGIDDHRLSEIGAY